MAAVIFTISPKVGANGMSEIKVRFLARQTDQRAHSGIFVPAHRWDSNSHRVITPRGMVTPETIALQDIQARLDALRAHILAKYMENPYTILRGWLNNTILDFHNVPTNLHLISDLVQDYINEGTLGARTADHYKVLKSTLEEYAKRKYPLYIERFNVEELDRFTKYLADGTRGQNTINAKLRKLRCIVHRAVAKKIINEWDNPFHERKIAQDVYGTPIFLTIAEREQIYRFEGLSPAMAIQRDIFIFQCLVGCRVSDLRSFTHDNVHEGFLEYVQQKVKKDNPTTVRVPLCDTAMEIINRYADLEDGRLLPFISDVKYNVCIKRIVHQAGVDRLVLVRNSRTGDVERRPIYEVAASHLARRTFMANMYKQTKSERIVSSFTGHVDSSRAFKRYTTVDDEMKIEAIRDLDRG